MFFSYYCLTCFCTSLSVGESRVADPGSGAFLTPGSGIRNRFFPGSRIPDPGSQTHIFESLVKILLGKNFSISLKIVPNFFSSAFQNKIRFKFVEFVTTKKSLITNFFSPLSFVAVFGSEIRDPGLISRIRNTG